MADAPQRHPNLNLTPEEKRVFYQLFQAADTTNLGVITGEIAVPFFEKTHLPSSVLGEIWQLADKENRGLLTPSGFGIVLRLIGHAQAGRVPSDELALQPGPIPRFDGIVVDNTPAPSESGTASPPPGAGPPVRVPPLQPEDAHKFLSLFEKSDTPNGMISGETAKQIFERARLPNEVLGRIWNLADTKQRGALDATDFIIAMHLLTSYKAGTLRVIPQTLPPPLYEAAARRGSGRGSFGARANVPAVPNIPKQFSGPQRASTPLSPNNTGRLAFGGPIPAQPTGDWLINPQEKAHFDTIFETVDTAKLGSITGDQAVAFFMKAQLPEEVLAQIWDLADIDADGQLNHDEFAVAMYLVRLQRSGKEPLPQVLPPALIPPKMRRQAPQSVAAQPQAPMPPPAPAPVPRSAADDLFGLDSPPQPVAQTQFPQSTGGSNTAFQTPGSPASRGSPQVPNTQFKPFVPTSSFGQTLQPQMTGASSGTPAPIRSPPPPSDDLLGDNDPEESKKLTQETSDLANLSNQIGSLAKEMHTVQGKRTSAEQSITQASQQKRDFEARLAQARAMYEQEVANFKALEERLRVSRAETAKLQQEYALIEGSRQDLQTQYSQVSSALATDQQENASLKEKIRQANAEVAQLKPALEKARSDARQQKGLVAINKKQLATVEGDRDKIQGEIDSLAKETPRHTESPTPVSSAADVTSPALSTASQNTNPFFRRPTTAPSSERAMSPETTTEQQKAFDNLFGQSIASQSTGGPPPTSFRAESPFAANAPATSNVPTPSASPVPAVSVPGAFPDATFEGPFAGSAGHLAPGFPQSSDHQSVTSSTVVSPPASRFGGPDTTGIATPSQDASDRAGTPSIAESSDYSRAPPSASEDTPARSPFDEPGAAAGGVKQTPSSISPNVTGNQEPTKDLSFDELFGSKAHKRSESQKENDFEEAFASMSQKSGEKPSGPAAAAASTSEFPPIQELDHDEEDDESSDDEGGLGFDDNFNPASPSSPHAEKKLDAIDAAQLASFPTPGSAPPPAADAQLSPPHYEDSTAGETSNLPAEYKDLLPERADPTTAPDAPHSVQSSSGEPIIPDESQQKSGPEVGAPVTGGAKVGGPDFDAAFAGLNLAPAKEIDDDDEDDEADAIHHKEANDFDFSFDSPAQTHHGASSSGDVAHAGSSNFFSFDDHTSTAPVHATTTNATTSNEGNGKEAGHDWDALFAPLEGAKAAPEESDGNANTKAPGWALGTETGEDDLLLQRLTGMGFPREDSLAALEKFDYNIDKAVDYLTSKA